MNHLTKLYDRICTAFEIHKKEIFNYTIPESWDLYGCPNKISTKQKELIVNPYEFTMFTLQNIMAQPKATVKQLGWYKESILYYQITRLSTAWDHDRTSILEQHNLYQLNEQGTFLKAIWRLPFYQRMGINTIILSAPFALGKAHHHEFPNPNAISSFQFLDPTLKDSLLKDMPIEEQYLAFEECAHHLGFHIIWQVDFTTMARDNEYIKDHPDWFYWIPKEHLHNIHAPQISYLAQNSLPTNEIKSIIEQSEDFQSQQTLYVKHPAKKLTLKEIEQQQSITTAPFLHDRINSSLPMELDYTPLRFYKDSIYSNPISLRCDLYSGKHKNTTLWNMIQTSFQQLQKNYNIDGFYFTRIYLYPQAILQSLMTLAKDKQQVVLVEESANTNMEHCDGISGTSAYIEYDVWNHQLHNFAYSLLDNHLPVFAAAEFYDTLRIPQHDSYVLTTMLHVVNLFLPNSVPFFLNGMECMEEQPILLSYFQQQSFKNALSKHDPRFQKQPFLDSYYFEYRNDGIYMLPQILERVTTIRRQYLDAISNKQLCTPLWFNSPRDAGIGFAYHMPSSILLVIANTDIHQEQMLCVHMDNVLANHEGNYVGIHQIYSTIDPFTYDITMSEVHTIPLSFQPGEVKFLELSY